MGDLTGNLRRRVRQSRRQLQAARAAGNEYEIDVYSAELEDLLRRASSHGVVIDDVGDPAVESTPGPSRQA